MPRSSPDYVLEDVRRMIVLGVVQGLTEFLPISSSGHLIITREPFGWEFSDDLTLDVSFHLGTTVALVAFYWREWWEMARAARRQVVERGRERDADTPYGVRLLLAGPRSTPRLVQTYSYLPFVIHRFAFGAFVLIYFAV